MKSEEIMVQEIIPGDGEHQFSYCAFFRDGQPHSTLVAVRKRQYPREFGRAATYVESIELPVIEELSERLLFGTDYPLSVFHFPCWGRVSLGAFQRILRASNRFDRQYLILKSLGIGFQSFDRLMVAPRV